MDRKTFTFNSDYQIGPSFGPFSQDVIKAEPMLFSCDMDHAYQLGGPVTCSFLDAIDPEIKANPDFIVDTRVHMLMNGWFPAIPGWHHDDVTRTRDDKQPDYRDPSATVAKHVMALCNAGIAPTEFATGTVRLDEVLPGEGPIYKKWHRDVEQIVRPGLGVLNLSEAPDNKLIYFDATTFHQGVRATGNGWRWFGRASWNTTRKPVNELRRQVQVYLEFPMEGW